MVCLITIKTIRNAKYGVFGISTTFTLVKGNLSSKFALLSVQLCRLPLVSLV